MYWSKVARGAKFVGMVFCVQLPTIGCSKEQPQPKPPIQSVAQRETNGHPSASADLAWVWVAPLPSFIQAGEPVAVRGVIHNRGSLETEGSIRVIVGGVALATLPFPPVPGKATTPVDLVFHYLGEASGLAVLTLQAEKYDANSQNNAILAGTTVFFIPDWVIRFVQDPVTALVGGSIAPTVLVRNATQYSMPAHKVAFYLSSNDQFNPLQDVYLGEAPFPALTPGAETSVELQVPLSALPSIWQSPGEGWLFAQVSDDSVLGGEVAGARLEIVADKPNLVLDAVSASRYDIGTGLPVELQASIRNTGVRPAGAFELRWYTGNPLQLLASQRLSSLAADATEQVTTTVAFPPLVDGSYTLQALVDAFGEVDEQSEGDNLLVAPQPFQVLSRPDLAVAFLDVVPATAPAAIPVAVRIQWRNRGYAALVAGQAVLRLEIAPTEGIAAFVANVTYPALPAQAEWVGTYTVSPLRGPGSYAWFVTAQGDSLELSRVNNSARHVVAQTVLSSLSRRWSDSLPDSVISSPTWLDINADGTLDTIVGTGSEGVFGRTVALDGRDGRELWSVVQSDEVISSPAVADTDGDGAWEVFIGGRTGQLMAIRATDGVVRWTNDFSRWVESPVLADMNGDGILEIIVTAGGWKDTFRPGVVAILNAATGQIVWQNEDYGYEYYASAGVADLSGDGRPDIVVAAGGEQTPGYTALYRNDGTTYTLAWSQPATGWGIEASPLLVDVSGDGVTDVVVASMDGFVAAYRGTDGVELWRVLQPGAQYMASPAAADVTGDAGLEIVLNGNWGAWHLGYTGGFVLVLDAATGAERWRFAYGHMGGSSPILADLDGDGKAEVIATLGGLKEIGAWFPDYFKLFVLSSEGRVLDVYEFPGVGLSTPYLADTDGDGRWNIVVACAGVGTTVNLATMYAVQVPAIWPKFRGNQRNTGRLAEGN